MLRDGGWHDLGDVMRKTGLHEFRFGLIVDFLVKYNFVVLDKKHTKIRLTPALVHFLRDIEALETQ
ncbi:MAG: hypothetical protein QXE76_07640 [Candidatus Bathyarchaeia archaeon]